MTSNDIPATAGRVIKEAELRAYVKCSEFYHRGGKESPDIVMRIAQYAVEAITSTVLRSQGADVDIRRLMGKFVARAAAIENKTEHFTEPQLNKFLNEATLYVDEVFQSFSLNRFIPVYGPMTYRIVVSKTPIELHLSGVYRSLVHQTLHTICLSPYTTEHAIANDPVSHFKLRTLSDFVREHHARSRAAMHVFGRTQRGAMVYEMLTDTDTSDAQLKRIEDMVKLMETGHHYPVTPCIFRCPFKSTCKL